MLPQPLCQIIRNPSVKTPITTLNDIQDIRNTSSFLHIDSLAQEFAIPDEVVSRSPEFYERERGIVTSVRTFDYVYIINHDLILPLNS